VERRRRKRRRKRKGELHTLILTSTVAFQLKVTVSV